MRVTVAPLVKLAEQVTPQVIPPGLLLTLPLPLPASVTERLLASGTRVMLIEPTVAPSATTIALGVAPP